MAISIAFSLNLYLLSSNEIRRGVMRQVPPINVIQNDPFVAYYQDSLRSQREHVLADAKNRLVLRLVSVNLIIVVVGGLFSYLLARRTLRPIEEVHIAQSRFVADASHELKTPITAMRAEAEEVLSDTKLSSKKAKQILRSNIEELDKLSALTDGLLRLARLDNKEYQKEAVEVNPLAQSAIDKVLPLAEKKKILINPKIDEVSVLADKTLLGEMLVILLDNAIKYSPEKSEILLSILKEKNNLKIIVADSGVGIYPADIPHIFDRFYRSDLSRSKNDTNGYGLGLSIAKSIVKKHSGTIEVLSRVNEGSTFIVSIPGAL